MISRLASGHGVSRGPKAGFLGETPSEIDELSAQISVVNVAETICFWHRPRAWCFGVYSQDDGPRESGRVLTHAPKIHGLSAKHRVSNSIRTVTAALADLVRVITARAPVHVTNATLSMNPECRRSAKSLFLLTNDTPPCYVETNSPIPGAFADDDGLITNSHKVPSALEESRAEPSTTLTGGTDARARVRPA